MQSLAVWMEKKAAEGGRVEEEEEGHGHGHGHEWRP